MARKARKHAGDAAPGVRTEHDSMGALQVPADALWGAQTQRAVQNFPISGRPMPRGFIRALALVKAAAAEVNAAQGHLPKGKARAIRAAALAVAGGAHDAQFPVDVFQTGSGTSSNMNANEVIATLASRAGGKPVHPNDDVNMGQSSNDVVPTAMRVAAQLGVAEQLLPALAHLRVTIDRRAGEMGAAVKTGRTHLMDAMPLTFAQELGAWCAQLDSARARLEDTGKRVRRLPIGGTAIGTGINADRRFGRAMAKALGALAGTRFDAARGRFEGIAASRCRELQQRTRSEQIRPEAVGWVHQKVSAGGRQGANRAVAVCLQKQSRGSTGGVERQRGLTLEQSDTAVAGEFVCE